MASAPTVLLCCWLAGHSGAWGQREFPKPLVGGSPSWVVAPGENVSIRCEGRQSGLEFVLLKTGHPNLQRRVVSAGTVAQFPLPSVGRADAGSYTCEYRPTTEPTRSSHLSDPVEIIVAEPSDPKPSISLRPSGGVSLGGAMTVRCRGQRRGRRFVLKAAGGQFLHKDSDGFEAEFPLSSLRREQGGSYSCSYHSKSEPFTVSYPSDPVELVLRDPSLPRPSLSLSPTGVTAAGADVTIRCQGPGQDVRFFLHQAGDLNRPHPMDPAGDGAEFHIRPVGRQHEGNYSCSYRPQEEPFISSEPSDPVELVVAGLEFVLHKAGHPNLQRRVVSAGSVAQFPLPSVGRADAGNYTCEYRPTTETTRSSHLSDPVEIIVAEPSDPKPSISLRPSERVSLGASVTVRCRGQRRGRRFVLKAAGGQFLHKDSDGFEAEFPLSSLRREQGGSYSCSYHSRSEPFTVSYPSDPVELVLRDPSLPRPSISLSPTGVTKPGADVTIRCQGPGRDVRFFVHQAGDLNWPRPMDPAGDGAEFHIRPVGWQHEGSYSCSYRPLAEPFVSSPPSDPVELVVAEREFPKFLVGGSPSWVVAPGENVSIRCEGRQSGLEFVLHKAGHPNLQRRVVSAGTVAQFPLPSVGRADAGSYTCEYHPTMEPTRSSHLSDPVEIIVAEPSDPKPSISLCPSERVLLGASVTVRCRGQRRGRRFVLKAAGGQFLHKDSDGFEAEFPLSSLRREQGGSYSCSYHSRSEPFTVSYPSDPVELVLRDPSLPRPSVSLSPTGVTKPGADVTIRCQGPGQDVRFFLHQAGDLNRLRPMDSAGDRAEFHIRPVGRQHGGNYSCSYRPRAEPFISSEPSDPVELVVAGDTGLTQPGVGLDPTRPGSAGPEAPPERPDFTHGNIARLGLGAGILLALGLILAEAYCSRPTGVP